MLKQLALSAIGLYQRYLSPRKGYSCSYRVHAGGSGCSGFGKHAIGKHGLLLGLVLLHRRMAKCAWQSHQHSTSQPLSAYAPRGRANVGRFSNQGGFVDCGSCDVPNCDAPNCDMPDLGCGDSRGSGGKGASSFCFLADCGSGCNSCGDGSGYKREQKRLARAKKRRDKANCKRKNSDSDDFDFGGSDSGDGGGD